MMDMQRAQTAQILAGWEPLIALSADWDRILTSCSKGVAGPDTTCSFTWSQALATTHLRNAQLRTLVVRSGSDAVAIVPTYFSGSRRSPLRPRELRLITQAHSGRSGVLAADNDAALIEFALESLMRDVPGWDVFQLGVVEGSESHQAVMQAASRLGLHVHVLDSGASPYVELAPTWDAVLGALPKKMRWTIRKSEKDLQGKGRLDYEEITTPDRVGSLLESIYAVERKSWKEESKTSITAHAEQQGFYETLVRLAAERGVLSAHVLRLNDEPLAYILGLAGADGVFLDLKESYDAAYREHSPGHVLKRYAIEAILARGVRLYDFMGGCEQYKLRWTDRTYRRVTLAICNRSFGGVVAHYRAVLSGRLRKRRPETAAGPAADAQD
jgi:CelD/BcsL family acetyltransferase involved in cellulose biosynthesis